MSFIEIRNVTKTFDGTNVLNNINVNVDEGTVLGILGRSGCGKSVLLNMLRGMKEYKPDKGTVIYNVAFCPKCSRVEPPSFNGKKCDCGENFEPKSIDF